MPLRVAAVVIRRSRFLQFAFLTVLSLAVFAETAAVEKRKIEALIVSVESLQSAVFVRNGKAYEPETAAKFLRGKWNQQSRNVRTAREFIEKVATRSSTTGRPYLVRYSDGREVPVAAYLDAELRKLQ